MKTATGGEFLGLNFADKFMFGTALIAFRGFHSTSVLGPLIRITKNNPLVALHFARRFMPKGEKLTQTLELSRPQFLYLTDDRFQEKLAIRTRFMSKQTRKEFDFWIDLLSQDQIGQISWFEKQTSNQTLRNPHISGSHFTSRGIINAGRGVRTKVYLFSFESSIDLLYFPQQNFVVAKKEIKRFSAFKTNPLLAIFHLFDQNATFFSKMWLGQKPKTIGQVIQSDRPMPHVNQELTAGLDLKQKVKLNKLYILKRAMFFSRETYLEMGFDESSLITSVQPGDLNNIAENDLLFHASWPNAPSGGQNPSWEIIRAACQKTTSTSDFIQAGKYNVFLAIVSGEKRSFVDEVETLVALVEWCRNRWRGKVFFVFDGWTRVVSAKERNAVMILQDNILMEVVSKAGLSSSEYVSLIGESAGVKVSIASKSIAYVSSGSPVVWPSQLAGIPGVIHGSAGVLGFWRKNSTGTDKNSKLVDSNCVHTLVGSKDRWDFKDYSIEPNCIVELFARVIKTETRF